MLRKLLSVGVLVILCMSFVGCSGPTGVMAGVMGPQGPQGEQGLTGSQGPQGEQGLTGSQGARGLQGDDGDDGEDGRDGGGGSDAECAGLQAQIAALEARLDILEFPPPIIDGHVGRGEWDGAVVFVGVGYRVLILSDTDYLYICFDAIEDDFYLSSGRINIYTYAGDAYAGECWAYCVDNTVGRLPAEPELVHFTTHHIQPPIVKMGEEVWSTDARVSAIPQVVEWRIPFADFPMSPGDPLAFDFMIFNEGSSEYHPWDPAVWLYEQRVLTQSAISRYS